MQISKSDQNFLNDADASGLRRAIQAGESGEMLRLMEAEGELRNDCATPYLAAILRRKDRWSERLPRNRPMRRRIKLTAVTALQKIGSVSAAEALCVGLFDRDEIVSRQSARALITFGGKATPSLLRILESRGEWTTPQMRLLIEVLDEIGDPRSGPALARVLLGIQPHDSARWFRRTLLYPGAFTVSAVTLTAIISMLYDWLDAGSAWDWGNALFGLALCLAIGVLGGALLFLPIFFVFLAPIGSLCANNERASLAQSAAEALIHLKDKRSLPSVIEAAYKGQRKAQGSARRVLSSLLPLLTEADSDIMPRNSLLLLLDSISPLRQAITPQSPDLIVAIVQSLRYIGPGSAVETVQKLEQRSDVPQIRDACREVIPILQARREQERASSSLLRASAQPATPNNQLLRPASAASETNANELLRPAD